MKSVFALIFCSLVLFTYAQDDLEIAEELHVPGYKDDGGGGLSFNLGASMINPGNVNYDRYSPGVHWSVRLRLKFAKSSNLVNGSIGLQFSEDGYTLNQEKLIPGEVLTYEPINVEDFGNVQVKMRSLSVPLLIEFRARKVRFLNRFKLETGLMLGWNASRVIQGISFTENDIVHKRKEKFDLDLPFWKTGWLTVLSFDNISVFYEHGFGNGTSSDHFNVARSSMGLSLFF